MVLTLAKKLPVALVLLRAKNHGTQFKKGKQSLNEHSKMIATIEAHTKQMIQAKRAQKAAQS